VRKFRSQFLLALPSIYMLEQEIDASALVCGVSGLTRNRPAFGTLIADLVKRPPKTGQKSEVYLWKTTKT
jgi:hypothetical protein